MSRPKSATESPAASALRKLRDAGGKVLGGAHFSMAEQAILWDLKSQGRVELVERGSDGGSGWVLVQRTGWGAP